MKDPWIKWFPGDFLHGVSELEANEGWVYTIVLNLIYDAGGPWPLSVDRLSRRCRLRPSTVQKALDALYDLGKLTLVDGCLTNGKAERSIKSRQKVSENSAEAANTRWEKERAKANENNDAGDAPAMPDACEADANQKLEARTRKVSEANASSVAGGDVQTAFERWNDLAVRLGLPVAKALTPERRKAIKSRLAIAGLPGWDEALAGVERSRHCRGENDRGWKADLDFVCQAKSFQRLREGAYGLDAPSSGPAGPARVWPGPADLRAEIVRRTDEDFALKWLDPCEWRADPDRLVAPNKFVATQLHNGAGAILAARSITLTIKAGEAVAA